MLESLAPRADQAALGRLLSLAHTLLTEESSGLGLADFPAENLPRAARLMDAAPALAARDVAARLYPHDLFLPEEGKASVEDTLVRQPLFLLNPILQHVGNQSALKKNCTPLGYLQHRFLRREASTHRSGGGKPGPKKKYIYIDARSFPKHTQNFILKI